MGVCSSQAERPLANINEEELGSEYKAAIDRDDPQIVALAADQQFDVIGEILKANGADPNAASSKNQMCAIHYAAKWNNVHTVAGLISFKADPTKQNSDSQTPLDIAEQVGADDVVRFLRSYKDRWSRGSHTGEFSRKTSKAKIRMATQDKESSNTAQRHFWVTIETRETTKEQHLKGILLKLKSRAQLRQAVIFVNHRRSAPKLLRILESIDGFKVSQMIAEASAKREAIQQAFSYSIANNEQHLLLTMDESQLYTDQVPHVISFDIPVTDIRTTYTTRAGGSKQVLLEHLMSCLLHAAPLTGSSAGDHHGEPTCGTRSQCEEVP